MSDGEYYYGYGVVPREAPAPATGVIAVPCEDLAVLARKVSRTEFGEEASHSEEWLSAEIALHAEILRNAMEAGPVVPWRFGAIFSTEERIRETVRERAPEFRALLERLGDRQEWTVRGETADREALLRHVRESSAESAALLEQERAAQPGVAYLLTKKRELLDRGLVSSCLAALAEQASTRLAEFAELAAAPSEGEEIFFKVAALLPRSERERLASAIRDLNREAVSCGVRWSLAGPFPPYSFVEGNR